MSSFVLSCSECNDKCDGLLDAVSVSTVKEDIIHAAAINR